MINGDTFLWDYAILLLKKALISYYKESDKEIAKGLECHILCSADDGQYFKQKCQRDLKKKKKESR